MPHGALPYSSSRFGTFASASLAPIMVLAALTLGANGCGGSQTPTGSSDMAQAANPDMTQAPGADMAAAPDMAMATDCTGKETFTEAYTALLGPVTCSGKNMCHAVAPYGAGLNLTQAVAYKNLVGVMASGANKTLVVAGDPAASFLYQKLTNTQGGFEGAPMPKPEAVPWQAPDPAKLKAVRCWIQNGAKND